MKGLQDFDLTLGRSGSPLRVENVTRWKIIQQQDPSPKSWRFGALVQMIFLLKNDVMFFLFQPLIFFGIGTSKFSQRDHQKKRHVVIFPSCLEFFVVRLSVSRDQISTPRSLIPWSYGALKDGLEPPKSWVVTPKSWVVTPQKLGCNPLKVGL